MDSETYVLDTNIVVGYIRGAAYTDYVDREYAPLDEATVAIISKVTHGELLSLAYQFNWGSKKKKRLQRIIKSLNAVDLNHPAIIDRYAEIDAFSQNSLPDRPLGDSDRNMGKNDVWIAATASVINAPLITTDRDFDHLHGEFLNRVYVDPDAEYDG